MGSKSGEKCIFKDESKAMGYLTQATETCGNGKIVLLVFGVSCTRKSICTILPWTLGKPEYSDGDAVRRSSASSHGTHISGAGPISYCAWGPRSTASVWQNSGKRKLLWAINQMTMRNRAGVR